MKTITIFLNPLTMEILSSNDAIEKIAQNYFNDIHTNEMAFNEYINENYPELAGDEEDGNQYILADIFENQWYDEAWTIAEEKFMENFEAVEVPNVD